MKSARDLMTPEPIFYSLNQSALGLFELFQKHKISLVPILNESRFPIGVVDESTAYRMLILHHYGDDSRCPTGLLKDFEDMVTEANLVYEDDPIQEVIKKLSQSKFKRVFVLSRVSDQLCGVISPIDVIDFVMGEESQSEEMSTNLKKTHEVIGNLEGKIKSLRDSLQTYQNIYENSPYMMHSVDCEGIIVMANKVLHKALKYNPGELIGKSIYDIYPESEHEYAKHGLKTIIETGSFRKTYTSMATKENWLLWVDVASSSLRDENDNFVATITTSRPLGAEKLQKALVDSLPED